MSNKQSSVDWLIEQLIEHRYIIVNKTTYGDKVKAKHEILLEEAKAMHKEEMETQYQQGREIGKIEILTSQSTKNASEYSQGYNKGFLAALEYMNSTIENKIKLRQYEQR
jgi:hypothetical protein